MSALLMFAGASAAEAQRTSENAVTAAQDAFGISVGMERIGLYNDREVRGFSPVTAGNVRLEGIYLDLQGMLNSRLVSGSTVRVGLTALGYPFPAPTGIVDYNLRAPGADTGISTLVQLGPFGGGALEVDARLPVLRDELSLTAGASLRRMENNPGEANRIFNFAIAPRWAPSSAFELRPFWGYSRNRNDVGPMIFVAGNYLPPPVGNESFGQPWTDRDQLQETLGLISRADLSTAFTLQAGVFRSRLILFENYSDLFRNTSSEGLANHVIIATPEQRRESTSGESRLTARMREGERLHMLHLMLRGRNSTRLYGGSASRSLGKARIGVVDPVAQPTFSFGPRSQDEVTQLTAGIGYEGRWAAVGEINVGLQKSHYEKIVKSPADEPQSIVSKPWLYNGTAAIYLARRLALYGGFARGMEENGAAPDVAANRGEALPAAITSQREFGVRYALHPNFRLFVSAFDLRKPYFNLDSGNVFTKLGSLRTRGVELSIAGPLAEGLNIVAGAALMDPRVSGEAVELGRLGERPVAQTQRLVRVNANHRLPFWNGASADVGLIHTGPIAASVRPDAATGEQLHVPTRTVVDLGGRYRFDFRRSPAVLRVQLQNAMDAGGWRPTPAGGFQQHAPRRLQAQLSVDF